MSGIGETRSLIEECAMLERRLGGGAGKGAEGQAIRSRFNEICRQLSDLPGNELVSAREKLWFLHCCSVEDVDFEKTVDLVDQVLLAISAKGRRVGHLRAAPAASCAANKKSRGHAASGSAKR